ncbi:MAG: hypothetical protein WEB30_13935 [Cyclobacteriaceae bacterium]
MGKLEDIPKKQIFSVPEDYFDKLPAEVQSRIPATPVDTPGRPVFRYALQYALPLIVIATILFFYIRPEADATSILATVDAEDLINYLHDSPMTTEDILENVDFYTGDLEAIENEVYDLELRDLDDEQIDVELNTL